MKTTTKLIFSLFALGLAATAPLARAADEPATPPMKHAQGGKRVQKAAQEHDKMLTEKLKLTAEQQTKLAAIRKDEAEQLKAVRGDRAKMADVLKTGREQVRAILTPEQQTEFDAIKPEGRGGKKGKKAAEQP